MSKTSTEIERAEPESDAPLHYKDQTRNAQANPVVDRTYINSASFRDNKQGDLEASSSRSKVSKQTTDTTTEL